MTINEKLLNIQNDLKAPKAIKEGKRLYFIKYCKECQKKMKIRSDYVDKHKGLCMSCLKKNNKCALKHGDSQTRLYAIWVGLDHRRYDKRNPKVCIEWQDYENFKKWALNNGYNDNLTIDRINNDGDYEPSNCQWITREENAGKDKKIFTLEEEIEMYKLRKEYRLTQRAFAELLGVSRNTIQRAEKRAKENM